MNETQESVDEKPEHNPLFMLLLKKAGKLDAQGNVIKEFQAYPRPGHYLTVPEQIQKAIHSGSVENEGEAQIAHLKAQRCRSSVLLGLLLGITTSIIPWSQILILSRSRRER